MTTRFSFRTFARLVVVGATILSISCAANSTAPVMRSVQSNATAAHDDEPDAPCLSGWQETNGHWVCDDPK